MSRAFAGELSPTCEEKPMYVASLVEIKPQFDLSLPSQIDFLDTFPSDQVSRVVSARLSVHYREGYLIYRTYDPDVWTVGPDDMPYVWAVLVSPVTKREEVPIRVTSYLLNASGPLELTHRQQVLCLELVAKYNARDVSGESIQMEENYELVMKRLYRELGEGLLADDVGKYLLYWILKSGEFSYEPLEELAVMNLEQTLITPRTTEVLH